MKKTLIMVLAMTGMTAMAVPSYIFFKVDQDSAGYSNYKFDYVTVSTDSEDLYIGGYAQLYSDDRLTTLEAYAGEFDSSYTGALTFELCFDNGDDPYIATYSYAAWKNYAYVDMGQSGATALVVSAIPEPTSALLLLLGIAGLALRRKTDRFRVRRECQRKTALPVVLVLALLTSHFSFLTCRAAANDTLISFSTKGPDKYLDGTTVKDGECYALVWTRTGTTFAGIAADGNTIGSNSQVIVFAPVAKNGRCPQVIFELDAKLAAAYANGSYGVYLLDTRLASGAVGGVNAAGVPVAVNGYGEVKAKGEGEESTGLKALGEISTASDCNLSVTVTTKSEVPVDAPKPQITAIRLVGDNVFLTVKNTIPCLQYAAKEVALSSDAAAQAAECTPAQGAKSTETEITIIAPKKGDSGFFSVGRR